MENSPYVFVEHKDICYQTRLKGVSFANKWLKIREDGQIIVLGSNPECNGYAWDGCSPKFFFFDVYFGTPDGIADRETRKPLTYYASLIHDVLYQFRDCYREQVSREIIDQIFLDELRQQSFQLSGLYFWVVRIFGWIYWQDIMRKYPWTKYIFLLIFLTLLWLLFLLFTSAVQGLSAWISSLF